MSTKLSTDEGVASPVPSVHTESPVDSEGSSDSSRSPNKRAHSDSEETEGSLSEEESDDEAEDHCPICLDDGDGKESDCPLCKVEFFSVISNIAFDTFKRFTFPPLVSSQGSASTSARPSPSSFRPQPYRRRRPPPQYGPIEVDEEQRTEAGLIYRYKLRAVHIGTNTHSGFQPAILQSQSSIDRVVPWIRRDLQVLLNDEDVELVKEHIIAIMKKMDMKSDRAIELLQPFLEDKSEHFVHELVAFARSSLNIHDYDRYVPYNIPQQLNDREHRRIHKMLLKENENLKKPKTAGEDVRSRGSESPEAPHP
ncbi:hypothetical protein K493DRAFT_403404 [Basidiobolus meristosporus CBS 931.73]|uniref:RING-type E3 ubiquitin transferase n=1 Tax=Basidiobolus meristosporus CBS 931.73 TaxID=1314790 RepID=A0A1Y1ZEM7_9FUNG|nr:hypothetical protein K493DRAFT_403404 [Basidiobolus meristosporus CBS 931.73]|eukprot:ORY08417.1 hypothetical protein K493DRAFT_403404 [Basidiobolus meristosporus CBS 931.73]